MSKSDTVIMVTLAILLGITATVLPIVAHYEAVAEERKKAIDAGVGRWVIDAKTGEKEFVYGREEK